MGREITGGITAMIGGIFILISTFLPAAYVRWEFFGTDMDIYYWIWGFYIAEGTDKATSSFNFAPEPYGFLWGIVIIIASIITIIKGNSARKGESGGTILLLMGILAIISMIAWVFAVELAYTERINLFSTALIMNFWDFFDFGIGFYTLFIGANIIIIGSIITWKR